MMVSQLAAVAGSAHLVICHAGKAGPPEISAPAPAVTVNAELMKALLGELLQPVESKLTSVMEDVKAMKTNQEQQQTAIKDLQECYHQMQLPQVKPHTENLLHPTQTGFEAMCHAESS